MYTKLCTKESKSANQTDTSKLAAINRIINIFVFKTTMSIGVNGCSSQTSDNRNSLAIKGQIN